MRFGLLVLALAACSPRGANGPRAVDDDVELAGAAAPDGAGSAAVAGQQLNTPRPEAPPGKGLRSGTIERAHLVAVLDAGLGRFLSQFEVEPRQSGNRFLGWQLVQLIDRAGPLHDIDVTPGDVLLSVNGMPVSRPEQAQQVWDSLRTANALTAQLWRGQTKLELKFAIEPAVTPSPTPAPDPTQKPFREK
jgi:hypothetical protein